MQYDYLWDFNFTNHSTLYDYHFLHNHDDKPIQVLNYCYLF
jgi:hypothetical protein